MAKKEESTQEVKLFDMIYNKSEEAMKSLKKPMVRRALKRKIRGAWDAAEIEIDELNNEKDTLLNDLTAVDLNKVIANQQNLKAYKETQDGLSELYSDLFGEEFNSSVE